MLSKMKPILALSVFFASIFGISPSCNKQVPSLTSDTIQVKVHDTISVKVHDTIPAKVHDTITVTIQPGPNEGQNAIVIFRNGDNGFNAATNQTSNPDISISQWTYSAQGWGEGTNRTFIKFRALDALPDSAKILSAKFSLYGIPPGKGVASPQGNSYYPGSPYSSYGDNSFWLKRALADWDEDNITWNNKPATTDSNRVAVPYSTDEWNYNVTDLDVTGLVRDMVYNKQNYGFCMQLQSEQIYRSVGFNGANAPDSLAAKRPKLVVVYTTH